MKRIIEIIEILILAFVSVVLFTTAAIVAACLREPLEIDMPDKETNQAELLEYLNKQAGGGYKII